VSTATVRQPPRPPGFLRHLWLLWGLRLAIGLNRGNGRSKLLAVGAFVLSSAPAITLGLFFYVLFRLEPVGGSPVWSRFILNLLCFVTAAVTCTWPLLSAGVDDHSELSRYAAYPISGFRLLVASTLASLLEPRSLFFYAPVVGASVGYARWHPSASGPLAVGLFVLFALLNAAWSRVGLHLVLNVLKEKRSAEMIGGFFVLVLVACSFIPPIDTSWLTAVGGGFGTLRDDVIANAALALGRVPPGFFGNALFRLGRGNVTGALVFGAGMLFFTAVGFVLAYRLLVRFYQRVGRGGPSAGQQLEDNPFARTGTTFRTLVAREALDLWKNPKARLLASVPFILAILIKLLSGRALFVFLLGETADAWVMGGLCLYGAVVIASTFSQNMFAYDGHGLAVFLSAPLDLAHVVRAKNAIHAAGAIGLGLLVSGFYRLYFGAGSFWDWACAVAAVLAVVPVLLAAGNFLSLYFPVKFHSSLKRRDKLPFAAAMLGVVATSVGSAPFVWALRLEVRDGATPMTALTILLCAALGWLGYRALLPLALATLQARREKVLLAITRE